ncbi:hypothetical protein ACYSNM_11315 [Myroides sp. LJL116]
MDRKQIINTIATTLESRFQSLGFNWKPSNRFVKKHNQSLYLYEMDVVKSANGYSLHLKLYLQNKEIASGVNHILKKVLSDPSIKYPVNFTPKVIQDIVKGRISNHTIYGLTDWRCFKAEQQTLEDFNSSFSIWFSTFEKLGDKKNWDVELLKSVDYAQKWFEIVDKDNFLIDNTDYVSLFLLKKKEDMEHLQIKYNSILHRKKSQNQDTTELELFYRYLLED